MLKAMLAVKVAVFSAEELGILQAMLYLHMRCNFFPKPVTGTGTGIFFAVLKPLWPMQTIMVLGCRIE